MPRLSRSARISLMRSSVTSSAFSDDCGHADSSIEVKPVSWANCAMSRL
jgi:hypothetical protein